jgi:hypothetical protein
MLKPPEMIMSSEHVDVPVVVDAADVAGEHEAPDHALGGRLRVLPELGHLAVPANGDLTALAGRDRVAVVADDLQVGEGQRTPRRAQRGGAGHAGEPFPRAHHRRGQGLGLPVDLVEDVAEDLVGEQRGVVGDR